MKKLLSILFFSSSVFILSAQVVQDWAEIFNGPGNGNDLSGSMIMDPDGNIYVTGESFNTSGGNDLVVIKYNPDGDTLWVRYYNGQGNSRDVGRAITIDSMGYVYVTGESAGTTANDIITIKYNSSGVLQWSQIYNGPANGPDGGNAIIVDGSGNVYVTGFSDGDPNVVFRQDDYVTIKYNSTGNEDWVMRYDGTSGTNDVAWDIAIDSSGNVFVTGQSSNTGSRYDYATIKYNSAGAEQWVKVYNGPANYDDFANAIAVDDTGNIFVTGSSDGSSSDDNDYATIKYNNSGSVLWLERFDGMGVGDEAYDILIKGNDLYVTGTSRNPSSPFSYDYLTIKYNSSTGDTIWTARFNGEDDTNDFSNSLAADKDDNIYVTGYSTGGSNGHDINTVKYNSSGVKDWDITYNGAGNGNDLANTVLVDKSGNVFVTGTSLGSGTANDIVTIKYIQQPTGVISLGLEIPETHLLLQNYPNPFNPNTVLPFILEHQTFVTLKVYDILGNEIALLINEEKPAGLFEEEFNSKDKNLASGIYYYKLQAGSYTEIKKMVLIK